MKIYFTIIASDKDVEFEIKSPKDAPEGKLVAIRSDFETIEDIEKMAGKLLSESAKKLTEAVEAPVIIQCACNDPSCTTDGVESGEIANHIEECPCGECHNKMGKL